MQQLIRAFKGTRLSTDINKDIVKLVAEMVTQALQLSEEQSNKID